MNHLKGITNSDKYSASQVSATKPLIGIIPTEISLVTSTFKSKISIKAHLFSINKFRAKKKFIVYIKILGDSNSWHYSVFWPI